MFASPGTSYGRAVIIAPVTLRVARWCLLYSNNASGSRRHCSYCALVGRGTFVAPAASMPVLWRYAVADAIKLLRDLVPKPATLMNDLDGAVSDAAQVGDVPLRRLPGSAQGLSQDRGPVHTSCSEAPLRA